MLQYFSNVIQTNKELVVSLDTVLGTVFKTQNKSFLMRYHLNII